MLESGFLTDRLSKIGFEWFKKSRFAKELVCIFLSVACVHERRAVET